MQTAAKAIRKKFALLPQRVRWCAPDSTHETGILVWTDDPTKAARDTEFIPWARFEPELMMNLLPRLFADPVGYHFVAGSHHGKEYWLVQLVGADGKPFGDVWFGVNPDEDWSQDGLIRVGTARSAPHVWQTYRRLSDGTYERLPSRFRTLEDVPEGERNATLFT